MKILMAASEMAPLVRNGHLGDAMAGLSRELRRLGHEVSVVLPYYRTIRESKSVKTKKSKIRFNVQVGPSRMPCEILETKTSEGVTVYLVARDEYFDRSGVYGNDGRDYQDNAARFIYFTKSVLELAGRLDPAPDILHANSWETALLPVFSTDQRRPFRTVLTPHSLEYQGNFWSYDFALTNLPGEYYSARGLEYYGSVNCLKAGILFSDAVVLPGERFVNEAQSEQYGCGLHSVLREHQHKLAGILPPLEDWSSPAKKDRAKFLSSLGLDAAPVDAVLTTIVPAGDGGWPGFFSSLDRLLAENVRLILLGELPAEYQFDIEVARRKYASRLVYRPQFDELLAREALSHSDFFLLPGTAEPHTLWLRRALRSGAIPIAAQCHGLFQTVRNWEPARDLGNGFVFSPRSVDGLLDGFRSALNATSDPAVKTALRDRCLEADFSVAATAQAHVDLYERLLGISPAARVA